MSEIVDDGPPGVPEWVVTYGDMMSLLLTFFIMLVSMSQMKDDNGRVRAMMNSLVERFGANDSAGMSGVPGPTQAENSPNSSPSSDGSSGEGGPKKFSATADGVSGAELTVDRVRDGTVITIGGPVMFAADSAEPTPALIGAVKVLSDVLAGRPNRIVVRGHASPEELLPPLDAKPGWSPAFPDHQALSFARASNVADALVEAGVERERILVSAVGDAEPRVVTADDDRRRVNRRVDVFVIDAYTTAPPPSGTVKP